MNYYGRRRYYSYRYPRRTFRRAYSSTSRSKRRAIGNYRAAIKQQDKTDVNLNISTKFKAFEGTVGLEDKSVGVYALNIWDLLRRSDFYKSYANMYDQIKINSIRVKLTPVMFRTHSTTNTVANSFYSSYTVVTAWDRTGLSEKQLLLYRDPERPKEKDIGTGVDDGGLYVQLAAKDVATYSSAITKSMSPNSNTAIIRTLYPSTIAEKGLYINTADLQEWYDGFDGNKNRWYGIADPRWVSGDQDVNVPTTIQGQTTTLQIPPYYLNESQFYEKNPSTLHESAQFPFKPTLLVGLLNESYAVRDSEGNLVTINPLAEFNLEADIGVTFRGLRKAPIVA